MFSNNKKELLYLIHIGIITGDLINKYSELFKSHHILYNTDVNDFEYGLIDSGEHACYGGTVVAHGDAGLPVNSEVKAKLTVADTCFQTIKKNFYILSI